MNTEPTEFDQMSSRATSFIFEAIDFAVDSLNPDGNDTDATFQPFAITLDVEGAGEVMRLYDDNDTDPSPESSVALGREILRDRDTSDTSPLCVALGWDGYLTVDEQRTEAVFLEAYELGRPASVLMAQAYERHSDGIRLIENPTLVDEPRPLIPRAAQR